MARHFGPNSLIVLFVATAAFAAGCGSGNNNFTASSGGAAGTGGAAGSGGTGASGGAAGTGGAAGSGGTGASGGTAGTDGGMAGTAGTAGSDAGKEGAAGAGGAAGNGGTAGTGGVAGAGGSCTDNGDEPNETRGAATILSSVSCGGSSKTHDGVAAMSGDTDWYIATAGGGALCSGDAKASVDQSNLRVCVFVSCQSGTTTRTCAQGTNATDSGVDGCCNTGGTAEATVRCSGLANNQAADLYIRVDQPSGNACTSYKLTYSY